MDPGSIIALTQIAFSGAYKAVNAFSRALKFFDDSETLVVQLELERFRLQTWGANSGLADGSLAPALLLVHETLVRQLDLIKNNFEDADRLRERYELSAATPRLVNTAETKDGNRVSTFVARMRKSLRGSGVGIQTADLEADEQPAQDGKSNDGKKADEKKGDDPGIWKRMRWGVRDKQQFANRIAELRYHISTLNQLLTETQQRKVKEDSERIKIIVVGSAVDEGSLSLIQSAVGVGGDLGTHAMAGRKALLEDKPWTAPAAPTALNPLTRADVDLPERYAEKQRFLAFGKRNPGQLFLLEKKPFDPNIPYNLKAILFSRFQRLIMLLNSTKPPSFRTPKAIGYIHDPANFCWWLVFDFPVPLDPFPKSLPAEPLTLAYLLEPSTKFKPPLEQRLQLAISLCTTLSDLYSSGWLHKSLRSANILFSAATLTESSIPGRLICAPLVSGFEYSRQESEAQTIDRARSSADVAAAIYRHAAYQGEAAQGYRVQFDVYSLGLVLVEVALWVPLRSFLDAKDPAGNGAAAGTVRLSSSMQRFHRDEALVLKKRVLDRLDKELAFRVGAVYYQAVMWCLTLADQPAQAVDEDLLHPALEFYNNVVAPLNSGPWAYRP